ncbi:MAG TPA: acyl-CoA-binding protein [Chryseolinea sp.]
MKTKSLSADHGKSILEQRNGRTKKSAAGNIPAYNKKKRPKDVQKFESAVERSKQLTKRPTNEELLELYSLYKQATEGDATGERPGGFDFKAIAKYDAWSELKGKPKEQAMEEYVSLVERLHQQYA